MKSSISKWSCLAACVLLIATMHAKDVLSHYEEVTTRDHTDYVNGFQIRYPYEWEPGLNPIAESVFYVGEPYAMPSFWVGVREIPTGFPVHDSLQMLDFSRFTNHQGIEPKTIEFNGHVASAVVIKWTTADAGRHFVETQIISFYVDDRWFLLTLNQSDRDTHWRPRLDAMLKSFSVIGASE